MPVNVHKTMLYRIRGKGRGWVFSARHFLDIGSRTAVDKVLSRLTKDGLIRRLGNGIYDYPRESPQLGMLSPSLDAVAREIAQKNQSKLKITGPQATNVLGLTTQVPARIVYLTDGPSRRLKIGEQTIILKHASPKMMSTAETGSGTVIQALKHIGKAGIDSNMINKIKGILSDFDKKELRKDLKSAHDWMRPVIMEITE